MPLVKYTPHDLGNHLLNIGVLKALFQTMKANKKTTKIAPLSEKPILF